MRWLALIPGAAFAAVLGHYAGATEGVFWICNLSVLLLAVGILAAHAVTIWTATIWLILGTPLWLGDLAAGGSFHWHSLATHGGGIATGFLASRRLPAPRRVWPFGIAFGGIVWGLTRLATPPAANVNAAFAEYSSPPLFPSYAVYFCVSYTGLSLAFLGVEALLKRLRSA